MISDLQIYRNKLVLKLSKLGLNQSTIAEVTELTQGRVSQILGKNADSLSTSNYLGAPCKLDSPQKKELKQLLDQGAEASGFEGRIWTADRVKQLIQDKYDISYHKNHIPKLLKKLGYSLQVPKKEDFRKSPEAVENWKEKKIKEIKKKQS